MSLLDAIKAFDVRDYLGRFGKVSKSGGNNVYVNPCPLCGDRHNKFYANVSGGAKNGTYNSYCCHDQGGLLDLIMKAEETTRFEATYQIESAFEGEDTRMLAVLEREQAREWVRTMQIPEPVFQALPEYPCWVRDRFGCLAERGADQYIIDRHRLRITQGAVTLYGKRREDLDHRLLIPVFKENGSEPLSWQARDLTGRAERKYLFPAGDQSANWLYDFQNHRGTTLMVVEGVFHKWAWDRLGRDLGNPLLEHMAVASFGKKLTEAQIHLLMGATHISRVIIGWDLDAAPQIVKIAEILNGRKELLIMPAHPSGRDHDELDNAERMALLASAEPWSPRLAVRLTTSLALGRI